MQDLFTVQVVSAQTTSVSSKKPPQSEFPSRDEAEKKDFMDAVRNAISSEESDSAPEKAEHPKGEFQQPADNEKPAEQQTPTDSVGNETIIIPVDPSCAAVFPDVIAFENVAATTAGTSTQPLTQSAMASQVQAVSVQTAAKAPVQQAAEQTIMMRQTASAATSEQSSPVLQVTQNTTSASTQAAVQTNAFTKMQTASEQMESGDGKASLTSQKSAEAVADGSLVKTQQAAPDTIFVKVGENGMPKEPNQLTSQLGEKIQTNFANGRQEFDIQLNPQELGKIHIKMSFADGKVTILVHCSNPETQQLLAANAGQLREVLENSTGLRAEVMTNEQEENQSEKGAENQAKEEQKDRQKEQRQHYHTSELELSAFLQKFRLGLMELQ